MSKFVVIAIYTTIIALAFYGANADLDPNYYDNTCSNLSSIVREVLEQVAVDDERIGAKLIRMHFHDCFVNGCDGSILLDGENSEKTQAANNGSVLGYEVIDDIKTAVENSCPGVVSCADILALASQISVVMAGGPEWEVPFGRLDSRSPYPNQTVNLPSFLETVTEMSAKFSNVGLNDTDLVTLSGAHTLGKAQCFTFRHRLYNFSDGEPDTTLDTDYASTLRQSCPETGNDTVLHNLDLQTPYVFDNYYYVNLQNNQGLLQTDQELFSNSTSDILAIVNDFANNQSDFFVNFINSMIKMGNILPSDGIDDLEVRLDCKVANSVSVWSA